ncbi:MAG: dTDP-4-dehydrorhamnose reductase [Verrucomicrobiota bacterium]
MADNSPPKLRVAVVGARGRLGSPLCVELEKEHEVIKLGRDDLNLERPGEIGKKLEGLQCDVLVNTAAMTSVDDCEGRKQVALRVNAEAAGALANFCRRQSARMIQISTDFVFNGKATKPYLETDPVDPINVYGATKLAGEGMVLDASEDNLVVRVSWVYGHAKQSFPQWLLGLASRMSEIAIPGDKIASPTCAESFAKAAKVLVRDPGISQLLHFCNPPGVSYFEFGKEIIARAKATGHEGELAEIIPNKLTDVEDFIAKRPPYSVLGTNRLEGILGEELETWPETLDRFFSGEQRA